MMAIAPVATTMEAWDAPNGSTGDTIFFLGVAVPPRTPEERALVERIIARSADPNGIDRQALLDIDDAWGLPEH